MRISVRVMLALPMLCTLATGAISAPASRWRGAPPHLDWHQFRFDEAHTGFNPLRADPGCLERAFAFRDTWQGQLGDLVDFSVARRRRRPARTSPRATAGCGPIRRDGCGHDMCADAAVAARRALGADHRLADRRRRHRLHRVADECPFQQRQAQCVRRRGLRPRGMRAAVAGRRRQGGHPRIVADRRRRRRVPRGVRRPPLCLRRAGLRQCIAVRPDVDRQDGRLDRVHAARGRWARIRRLRRRQAARLRRPAAAAPATCDAAVDRRSRQRGIRIEPRDRRTASSTWSRNTRSRRSMRGGCGSTKCEPLWQAVDKHAILQRLAGDRLRPPLRRATRRALAVYAAGGCGAPACDPVWLLFGSGLPG